ncbi:MAG: serine hydrolase [Synechococcales cyanobacterium T60_A2020_003]|nr:serine hydrolase [Synechococcales cyanobacterium T60_A2020_003]
MLAVLLSCLCFLNPGVNPLLAIAPPASIAQSSMISPQQALERLFTESYVEQSWFAESFLNQVPLEQIRPTLDELTRSLGAFQSVEPSGTEFMVQFEQGRVPVRIALDAEGRIAGLVFKAPILALSLDDTIAQFQALPGDVSVLVLNDGEELTSLNPDQRLAVGSAFKLVVLDALRDQIETGDRQWDDVVTLQPHWRSLPSGIMQDWPVGTSLTLETLATLMVSLSDNTATDALIDLVGREDLEARSPQNTPFLTTRSLFALKNPDNASLLDQYRSGNEAERRAVLEQTTTAPLPPVDLFSGDPIALDVEWFFSARELCQHMDHVADLPLMGINPGVATPADWADVAFKGGAEPGVLNLTTHLKAYDGSTYCVVATWNNPKAAVNEAQLLGLYSSLIDAIQLGIE